MFGFISAAIAKSCGRIAREVVNLARTEIAEVVESSGHHRGASSTMPQKDNPVSSEAIIGLTEVASASSSALMRSVEAVHERAAGEWHIEWYGVPEVAYATASAIVLTSELLAGMQVNVDAMETNLELSGSELLAEAYMMQLANEIGREQAHDRLYAAVRDARRNGRTLESELFTSAGQTSLKSISPRDYLGDVADICNSAIDQWSRLTGLSDENGLAAREID